MYIIIISKKRTFLLVYAMVMKLLLIFNILPDLYRSDGRVFPALRSTADFSIFIAAIIIFIFTKAWNIIATTEILQTMTGMSTTCTTSWWR